MAKNILIIDDEPDMCIIVTVRLERLGYKVISAGTAEDGLALIEKTPPDLILLDLRLPGMQGEELCKILKSNVKFKPIPIIFFTANISSLMLSEKSKNMCADDCVIKPFKAEDLIAKIKKFIG